MQVPGATAPGTHRQAARKMRLRSRSKCGRFFVPDMNPFDAVVGTNCFGDPIERVTRNTVNSLNPCRQKGIDEELREILLSHCCHPRWRPSERIRTRYLGPSPSASAWRGGWNVDLGP